MTTRNIGVINEKEVEIGEEIEKAEVELLAITENKKKGSGTTVSRNSKMLKESGKDGETMTKYECKKETRQSSNNDGKPILKRNKTTEKKKRKRGILKISTWNVRTLLKPGKMNEVANELRRYKIDIAAIQEVRWKEHGQLKHKDYEIWYSGEKKQGKNGVAFYVSRQIADNVIDFKAIHGRMARIRIRATPRNITIINVYAYTEDNEFEKKQELYEEIEEAAEAVPRFDMLIIMGDMNAQVGKEEFVQEVAGKETIHERTNENGKLLCNLAAALNMEISSTRFKHREIHKITWNGPGMEKDKGNQIDHILTSKKTTNSVKDVRSYRGANVDTDHFMVVAKIRQERLRNETKEKKMKWNTDKLRSKENQEAYIKEVEKQLSKNTNDMNEINEEWNHIQNSIQKGAEKILGVKKKCYRKEWFDERCEEVIKLKNEARKRWMGTGHIKDKELYKQKEKEANRTIRQTKNRWIEQMMDNLEEDSKRNNTKKFYDTISNKKRANNIRTRGMKNKQGKLEITNNKIKQTWKVYFESMLHIEGEDENIDWRNKGSTVTTHEEVDEPTYEEYLQVLAKIRNGKAAGADEINGELIKEGGEKLKKTLYNLITQIWKEEKIPQQWRKGVILPIHKNGDEKECRNYRGITLLSVAYKILSTLINNKLRSFATQNIGEYQMGFVKGKSTVDAIHITKQIIEKCREHNIDIHMLFIDFKRAFDSVKRPKIIRIMKEMKIPEKIIRLVWSTMEKSEAIVSTREGNTETFETNVGIRQGDSLSSALFNIVLEHVIRKVDCRGIIRNKEGQIIAYADDVLIIGRSTNAIKNIFKNLEKEAKEIGLTINENKSKYMQINTKKQGSRRKMKINKYEFEEVSSFKYLGVRIGNAEEINEKILAANKASFAQKNVLKDKRISTKTKIKVYRTMIRPILTYAAETMTLTMQEESKLRIFERRILRRIMGGIRNENGEYRRRTNQELRQEMGEEDIINFIKSQRMRWLGHIQRQPETSVLQRITTWKPMENRKRGRPKKRWYDDVTEDLRAMGVRNWKEMAVDRDKWRKIVKEAKTHPNL